MIRALFTLTIFLSSALLFLVEPMVARMILPSYGGSPAVWTASMVFFQAFLLLGYAYAHYSIRAVGPKRHVGLHLILMALAAVTLPFALPAGHGALGGQNPTAALLLTLTLMVGVAFFVISSGAPLLQRWFAFTGDKQAHDPYFLYSSSNLGSLLALFAYPFLVEPKLRLAEQAKMWSLGYGLLVVLMIACGLITWSTTKKPSSAVEAEAAKIDPAPVIEPSPPSIFDPEGVTERTAGSIPRPREQDAHQGPTPEGVAQTSTTNRTRIKWVALAAVPSSLLLGVTAFLSTNVAPVPLLWVIPLGFYLLTFILAFARLQIVPSKVLGRIVPLLVTPLAVAIILESDHPIVPLGVFHLVTFFVVAWMCHARLSESRPDAAHLTEFYLWISVGGVVGGIFNAIVAPTIFNTLAEYPIALIAACMLRPPISTKRTNWEWAFPLVILAVSIACVLGPERAGMPPTSIRTLVAIGIPLMICFLAVDRPVRYGLALGAVFLVADVFHTASQNPVIYSARSFFGVHRVTQEGRFHKLTHGNTVHGIENMDDLDIPLTYYSSTGPIGDIFKHYSGSNTKNRVAMVGLGVGSLASYGVPGQQMTYFEIDPVVVRIASDPKFFTFLKDSRATMRIVLGDARLTLAQEPDGRYGMIVLDAFSSDSIPIHLLTIEAFQMYLRKLEPGGIIAIHISNRYLTLEPVLAGVSQTLNLKNLQYEEGVTDAERAQGKQPSDWVVLARSSQDFLPLKHDVDWTPIDDDPLIHPWTDDFANVLSVFHPEL